MNPFGEDHRTGCGLVEGLFGVLLVAGQPPEHAEPAKIAQDLDLRWHAPSTCPGEARVRRLVNDALFEEAVTTRKTGLRVAASIAATSNGYALVLELREGEVAENTEVVADSCDLLAEFVALKVALALNPVSDFGGAAGDEAPLGSDPVDSKPVPPEAPPSAESSPAPPASSARRSRPSVFAQVLGGVGRGVLPTLDGGPGLTIGVQGSHWRALAGAYVLFSPATRLAERDGAGVRFLHPGGELGACYQLREASVVAPICLGTQVGAVRAQGFGLDLDMTAWRPYVGVGAEVAVVWPADAPVRLAARLGTQATLLAPRFHVTGLGPIHQSSPITGRLSVGVEVRMSRRNRNRPTPPLTGRSP